MFQNRFFQQLRILKMLRPLSRLPFISSNGYKTQRWALSSLVHLHSNPSSNAKSLTKHIHSSSVLSEKNYDQVNHHVLNYLKVVQNPRESLEVIDKPTDLEQIVRQHIVTIANSDYEVEMIVNLFNLYATHKRPIMQDKSDIPKEFTKMIWKVDQLTKYMNYEQLKSLSNSLMMLRGQKLKLIDKLILSVCSECSSRLTSLSLSEGIQYFEIILVIFASGMGKRANYEIFTEFFQNNLDEATATDLVKLMHYSSFSRNDSQNVLVQKALEKLIDVYPSMSYEMLGIVSNSILKGGVPLLPTLPIIPYICDSLLDVTNKCDRLTLFQLANYKCQMKLLRLCKYKSSDFITNFQKLLLVRDPDFFDGQMISELLGFFAHAGYSESIFTKFEKLFLNLLQGADVSLSLSEYARVLWSFSHTNHKPSTEFVDTIHQDIHFFLASGRAYRNYSKCADVLYSLAIMGLTNPKVLRDALTKSPTELRNYGTAKRKMIQRLSCIREHVMIEHPEIVSALRSSMDEDESRPQDTFDAIQNRPALLKLSQLLNEDELFHVCRPIKTIGISSIVYTSKSETSSSDDLRDLKSLHPLSIEVVDHTNTVPIAGESTCQRSGLLNYKLRLLTKANWNVFVVDAEDVLRSQDLNTLLKEMIVKNRNTRPFSAENTSYIF